MKTGNAKKIDIENGKLVDEDKLSTDWKNALKKSNIIYVYYSTKTRKIYVGQTKHFNVRHKQHFSRRENKFNVAKFDRVIVLTSKYFNGTAMDDVERQLITYFIADNPKKERIDYERNRVINLNSGNTTPEYRGQDQIPKVISEFWTQVLYKNKLVHTKFLKELQNQALFKYSPIKTLTDQQRKIINQIIKNPNKNYVINGDAGTGKTVLLTNLVAQLYDKKPKLHVGVVVQSNWKDTAKKIFKEYGILSNNFEVTTSTALINSKEKFDIIIVDEAHRLSRRYSKQQPSFNLVYKQQGYEKCQSHLEILIKMSKQIVLMYDVLQAIRPSNVTRKQFSILTKGFKKCSLKTQLRIESIKGKSYTSDDYINGIKWLLYKDTGLLNKDNFNPHFDRTIFKDNTYFGYFKERPLHAAEQWINKDRNFHPEHIDRILASFIEPWSEKDGKDITKKQWHEDDINLRWNSTQKNWITSADKDAEDQIGSIFAVQGLDLDKVVVLIGNDLEVSKDGKLYANPKHFYNVNGKFKNEEAELEKNKKEFTLFVLNIYYVLLTRGIEGVRIGFWHNDKFRKYMEKALEIN